MSKLLQKEKPAAKKRMKSGGVLVLEPINYKILAVGIAIIVLGYFALSAKPWDNPLAITVAPILLVLGYCVVIPVGIMYRRKHSGTAENTGSAEETA
jgi:uncharacterized membrane protein